MSSLEPHAASGYTVILPPGWLRLDARTAHGTAELDRELDAALATVSRDSRSPLIDQARKQAHDVLEQARAAGALDLYLPLGGMHGAAVPASFLVGLVTFNDPPPDLVDPHDHHDIEDSSSTALRIATMLAARIPQGEVRTMPAGMAVRSRRAVAATGESQWPGTRLDYHWPMPSEPLKWAVASFTAMGAGKNDVTELLVGLFDAIMLTWRWRPGLVI
jgi:hypothetical protein